jgi:hypothetical protein
MNGQGARRIPRALPFSGALPTVRATFRPTVRSVIFWSAPNMVKIFWAEINQMQRLVNAG